MSKRMKTITAAVMAVIFFVGILPVLISWFGGEDQDDPGIPVRVKLADGQIRAIPIEEYLVGVVAAEMPAEFEAEALKAQAVAARTYVLKRMESAAGSDFDVDTTVNTQAWNTNKEMRTKWGIINYWKYQRKIADAVKATQGKVVTYQGKMINAFFYSSCGRKKTERAGDVWSTDLDYLKNVPSGESDSLRFVKHQIFQCAEFYQLLGFTQIPEKFSDSDVILIERTKAGRVKTLAVRNKVFKGTELRSKLQLSSTDFEWETRGTEIEFVTYGKGHGVGMSQYGANDLALKGESYMEILGHYYQGTKLEKTY